MAEPTKDMAAQMRHRVRNAAEKAGLNIGISRVGFSESAGEDHMASYVREIVESVSVPELSMLRAVDACVAVLVNGYRAKEALLADQRRGCLRDLVRCVLAYRHRFVDSQLYSRFAKARATALDGIRVLVVTPPKLCELKAGVGEWSSLLQSRACWSVLGDEFQRLTWKQAVAMGTNCDSGALVGDVQQASDSRGGRPRVGADGVGDVTVGAAGGRMQDPLTDPFCMAPQFLRGAAGVQRSPLEESLRLGERCIQLLKYMFPGRDDSLISGKGPASGSCADALVLLTLFKQLRDWTHDPTTQEVLCSPTFFSQFAVLLSVEVVVMVNGPSAQLGNGIVVVPFLKGSSQSEYVYLMVRVEGPAHQRIPTFMCACP